jgi:hypothetical protein
MELETLKTHAAREIADVRKDLLDLKHCQLRYFTLALTGGAIFGLVASLGEEFLGIALLASLSLVLPNWLTFLDKATSITRITGYQRLLEKQICSPVVIIRYLGYENALAEFRRWDEAAWHAIGTQMPPSPRFRDVILLRTRHRFWMIHWYTFAVVSLICWVGAYVTLTDEIVELVLPAPLDFRVMAPERNWWALPALFLVALCWWYSLILIRSLIRGALSYEACAKKWEWILGLPPAPGSPGSPGSTTAPP